MLLPHSTTVALVMALLAMLFWGIWIATFKISKWRFELYAIDFFVSAFVVVLLAFFTLGTFGDGVTAMDNLSIVRKKLLGMAMLAGGITALGLMLQLALASIGGIAVSLLATLSVAFAVHHVQAYATSHSGNPVFALGSALLAVLAALLVFRAFATAQKEMANLHLRSAAAQPAKPGARPPEPAATGLGIALGTAGGILFGLLFLGFEGARADDIEMQAYPIALLVGLGALVSAPVYDLFFTNLPVRSRAISVTRYFKGSRPQHLAGIAGGALWAAGLICLLVAAQAVPEARVRPAVAALAAYGSAIPGALYGIVVAKEMQTSGGLILVYCAVLVFGSALVLSLFTA